MQLKFNVRENIQGYIKGRPGRIFGLDNYINRQELAVMIYRILDISPHSDSKIPYDTDGWSDTAIKAVVSNNIMKTHHRGKIFKIENKVELCEFSDILSNIVYHESIVNLLVTDIAESRYITRGEAIHVLNKLVELPSDLENCTIKDVESSHMYYTDAIKASL